MPKKTLSFLVSILWLQLGWADDITIFIRDDVYEDYQSFVKERDLANIDDYSGNNIRRDVVDMIIAQQALQLGGFPHKFTYLPGKLNFRNTMLLQQGKLLMSFDSYWSADAQEISDSVYISAPLIRNGEYLAGIYTHPGNKKVLAIKTQDDLKELTAVSTPKWRTDWATLEQLPLKDLIREDEWLSMARMVSMQWIDFILMPFNSTADQSFTLENITLVPVKNIAVLLKDSRHYVVSKNHLFGESAIVALDKGLELLRQQKRISKAYQQSGFFIDRRQYHIINQ